MRLLLSACLIVGITSTSFSQNDSETPKKLFYGSSLGLNYTNIQTPNNPTSIIVKNNAGFNLGVLGGYRVYNGFSIIANTGVSFHENELYPITNESVYSSYKILLTTIDFGLQVKANILRNNKKSPYITLGPAIQIPISQPVLSTEFGNKANIAVEFGIGCDRKYSEFTIAPEIKYSYGLNNVNMNPAIKNVNFHTIKFLFHFRS